ncbi:MAG TPA: Sua5/YciO/YrdC/YwlC family protein [Solirubrobacteraceae bacterium]
MSDAERFERCMSAGGVAVFPADTVYGLACDPDNPLAVERLYALKRRPLGQPSAVMFFDLEVALDALPELGERTRTAMRVLMPGGVSLLVPNPAGRFPLACGAGPATLGLRVPRLPRLAGVRRPILQSSANRAGGHDPRRLEEVPQEIRDAADLVIDGGELPGTPSTVVDLTRYDEDGSWSVVRPGMVGEDELQHVLGGQFHFRPGSYEAEIREDIPAYDELQQRLVAGSGSGARRILELGTGTGATALPLLKRHPGSTLVGVDVSADMLAAARDRLPGDRVELRVGRLEDELPSGPFDLVASALAVHHLDGGEKARLFQRVREVLAPTGRFVLADVVLPDDPADARIPLTPGFDKPSAVADQLGWLADAGFESRVAWEQGDLAVIVADASPAGIVGRSEGGASS